MVFQLGSLILGRPLILFSIIIIILLIEQFAAVFLSYFTGCQATLLRDLKVW